MCCPNCSSYCCRCNSILKIFYHNCYGLKSKFEFIDFFENLSCFHIIILSETWCFLEEEKKKTELLLKDFKLYWVEATKISNKGRGIGGMLIGYKVELKNHIK